MYFNAVYLLLTVYLPPVCWLSAALSLLAQDLKATAYQVIHRKRGICTQAQLAIPAAQVAGGAIIKEPISASERSLLPLQIVLL